MRRHPEISVRRAEGISLSRAQGLTKMILANILIFCKRHSWKMI
jgi:hypothetical protein